VNTRREIVIEGTDSKIQGDFKDQIYSYYQ